jgi:poly(3-hydroxybutyrate) depolymerase
MVPSFSFTYSIQSTLMSKILQDIFALCLIRFANVFAQPYNLECNFGSQALTETFNIDIPQTCFTLRGYRRCFYTFLPECATRSQNEISLPLVLDLHDYNDCPVKRAQTSGWMKKAIEECFIVVWPTVCKLYDNK